MSGTDFILTQDIAAHGGCPSAPCCGSLDLRLGDCMDVMKTFPDGHFDLAVVDPPYGIGASEMQMGKGKNKQWSKGKGWDNATPDEEYFAELARVSKRRIVWGGNYFNLPATGGWLFWDKDKGKETSFADGELAWNNLGTALRIKRHRWHGMIRKGGEDRHHPTQKPLEVIQWAIQQAGEVQTILDPWAGSGTTGHAAKNLGKRAVLIEREERYCEIAVSRLAQDVLQFSPQNDLAQTRRAGD